MNLVLSYVTTTRYRSCRARIANFRGRLIVYASFLQGKTPNELLSEARSLVKDALVQEARWHNGDTTRVTVSLDEVTDATLCVKTGFQRFEIEGWPGARFKSDDGLIDIPVEIAVGVDQTTKEPYRLGSYIWIEGDTTDGQVISEEDKLEIGFQYDLSGDSVQTNGALYIDDESNKMIEPVCLAWPVGGESDELCQSLEPDEDLGFWVH